MHLNIYFFHKKTEMKNVTCFYNLRKGKFFIFKKENYILNFLHLVIINNQFIIITISNYMLTQQVLKSDVLQYLRKNYSIKLEIPTFKRHLSQKINLKIFKSPLGEKVIENRYKLLIIQAQQLLKKNTMQSDKAKQFAQKFFETINLDLLVMQNNEEIRKNFTKVRDQITYRIQQLTDEQKSIQEECKLINDKEDILIFLQGTFKSYLSKVKIVSEHYDAVNNVQVYTSINIDSLYSEKLAQQEDYIQHFQPLLEVMQRLKANMIKLYQELNRCQYNELPLRIVNFLANCKNLLLQLQPFLIKPDCVFNRLIFHVTKGQKENNKMISNAFQSNIAFTNDIIADIFKSFFLGHIFADYYHDIRTKIVILKQQLIKYFQNKNTNYDNFTNYSYKLEKRASEIQFSIMSLKHIMLIGKDKIMREYLGRKQCKKMNLLDGLICESKQIKKIYMFMLELMKYKIRVNNLFQRSKEDENYIALTLNSLLDLQKNNIKTKKPANYNIKQMQQQNQQRIKESYCLIQNAFISINQANIILAEYKQEQIQQYFKKTIFPQQQQNLFELTQKYKELQINLLNNFQNLRKQKLLKFQQTLQVKKQIFTQLNNFFQQELRAQIGYEIRNQDNQCEQVKDNIIKIQKLQFMLNNYVDKNKSKADLEQLQKYKINLQWLLQVFQGSMDEPIFQKFIQKLNFQIQNWKDQISKVKELIKEFNRYINVLKNIIKSNQISKINSKVFKIVKNRTQLYEIISDMFEQFIIIYQTCKSNQKLNISDHGLKIFDQQTYKYILMLYQYKNRLRAQTQQIKDLLLPKKTINYLIDQLYQPFIQIFTNYVVYDQQELLNYTMRLQHALNYNASHLQIIKMFQQTLSKPYAKGLFQSITHICQQLIQLKADNKKVLDLENEEVVIYNLNEFKKKVELINQHIEFSQLIIQQLKGRDLQLNMQFDNPIINRLRAKLVQDWTQHRQQIQRQIMNSRADDFSQHQDS